MEPEKEAEETGKVFGADGGDGSVAEVGGADRAALSERERGRLIQETSLLLKPRLVVCDSA